MSEITMLPSNEHPWHRIKYTSGLAAWCTAAVLLAAGVRTTDAHPTVSVVVDSRGVVFFSDLQNVWMLRADGTKAIAVADVHTHELWIGADDDLYGEDVRKRGEAYRHRVWVRSPDGTVADVISWRSGHPSEHGDYSFVRDEAGNSYVLLRSHRRIDVRSGERVVRTASLASVAGYIHLDDGSRLGRGPRQCGKLTLSYPRGRKGS